jgi:glutamate-1-semialdehyde 2,1-aminomutase
MSTDTIDLGYLARNPLSRDLYERQKSVTPGGYTHMSRQLAPFPLFIQENRGSRKRDVDGNEYIDYWLGHGAMLIGHAHPQVAAALAAQVELGLHAGGESEAAVEWGELVQQMVPSAERVRFVATGGEATQMAIRVARACTGRDRIIKFQGSFHGWHDGVCIAVLPPFDVPLSTGVPRGVVDTVLALPFNDASAVESALTQNRDIAAIIMEPGGLLDDTVPSDPQFLRDVRELATRHNVVLIFDEVVTGFRYSQGGVQEFFGVTPDLTALGKVIGGGMPAGAVVGRASLMDVLAWRPDPEWARFHMIPHPGTWNAMPITAVAGAAALRLVRDTGASDRARQLTRHLVEGFNAVFAELGVEAFAYARGSIFKTCLGRPPACIHGDFSSVQADAEQLFNGWGPKTAALRKAMLLEGVDLMRESGFLSSAHTEADIDVTCGGLERALRRLQREDVI